MITCSNCGKLNPNDANFCQNCGHSLAADKATVRPSLQPTTAPRMGESERRFVTMLFCDVVGSTQTGELLDPEQWTEIMNGFFERLIPPVARYGGTVARLMGDAVLALFGAPVAHEDDPYRAVRAALDMLEEIKPYQEQVRAELANQGVSLGLHDLDVRIGINTGLAIVGEVGSEEKREYTAMGDTVNLAARMEQTAVPGTIQIAFDTYQAVHDRVLTQALDPLTVKGKREPVRAYRVLSLRTKDENVPGYGRLEAPLVGRSFEMDVLAAALDQLQAGHGRIICLTGEGGIGKSRLVNELARLRRASVNEIDWHRAESYSFEGSQPYGLFQRLLRRAGGIARDDSPQIATQKIVDLLQALPAERRRSVSAVLYTLFGLEGAAGPVQPQGEEFKRELFEGIRALVQAWAADKPTILVFEDLHWTDPASVELIKHLLPLADDVPLLLLCVFRPYTHSPAWNIRLKAESEHPWRYQAIDLDPLTVEAGNQLIGSLLNISELPDHVGNLLAEKASGVPFFIEEIVRDLIERGVLVRDDGEQAWQAVEDIVDVDLPDTLEAVLVSRMDRLDSRTRATLQLAAVIGRSFYFRVLEMITAEGNRLGRHIAELVQTGMILEFSRQPELQYMFRHVLAQEAAYNTILIRHRRQFHRLVGEAMEEIFSGQIGEQAPLLAHHFQQAGDPQRALKYYTIAAQNAARLYANEEAVNHFNKAIELADIHAQNDETLADLYHGRGPILEVLGEFEGARRDLETALAIAHRAADDMLEWRILLDLGNLWTSRDYGEAGGYYNKALKLARLLGDHEILARSLNRMGNWHANAEQPQQAIALHREALDIIELLDDPPGLANTLDLLGMANLLAGNHRDAHHYFDRAIDLFRQLDDRFRLAGALATRRAGMTYNNLRVIRPDSSGQRAEHSATEALQLSREIGWLAGESFAYWVLSLDAALFGEYGKALDMVEKGLHIATDIDHRQWMAGHEFNYAVLYGDLLDGENARQHAQRSLELARETGSKYWTNQATGVLARADLILRDLDHCRDTLDAVLDPSTRTDSHAKRYCWLMRAALVLEEGESQAALDILDRLFATFNDFRGGVVPSMWLLHGEALAAAGQLEEAETTFLEAIEKTYQGHPQLWRLYASYGHFLLTTGRATESEEAFEAGRRDVLAIAATIGDEQLAQSFTHRAYQRLK